MTRKEIALSRTAQSADGMIHEFPDETPDDVIDNAMRQYAQGADVNPRATKSEQALKTLKSFGRGVGLGVRYPLETPGLIVAGVGDILASGYNTAADAVQGALRGNIHGVFPDEDESYRLPTNRAETVYEGFSRIGFPEPEGELERLSERVSRTVTGAAMGPAAGARASLSANPVTQNVGRILQESPKIQAASAGTAAVAGHGAEMAGAGPYTQMLAEVGGGLVAPASVVAGRAATGVGRTALGVKDALTKTGQRKIVGNVIEDAAVNPQRATSNLADDAAFGPGISESTTGQASRDPGLLTLERAARSLDTKGRFSQRMSEANTARQRILDVIGGEDVAASKTARDVSTGTTRESALSSAKTGVPAKPIFDRIDGILGSVEGTRKVVRSALEMTKKDISKYVNDDGTIDARVLYELRKDINDAMQGKYRNPDRADFKMAKGQLKQVKNIIDAEIEKVAPGFRKYLEDYASLSRDIDQRGVIQSIQERATVAASDPTSGRDILSQAKFKRMVTAERGNGVLTDEQLTVMGAIADDLDSGQAINAATVRPPGSDTAKNLTVAHVIGRAVGGNTDSPALNALVKPIRWITSFSEDQVQGLLVEAMLDPKLARVLLAEANAAQVNRASQALTEIVGLGTIAAANASLVQQGLQSQEQPTTQQ